MKPITLITLFCFFVTISVGCSNPLQKAPSSHETQAAPDSTADASGSDANPKKVIGGIELPQLNVDGSKKQEWLDKARDIGGNALDTALDKSGGKMDETKDFVTGKIDDAKRQALIEKSRSMVGQLPDEGLVKLNEILEVLTNTMSDLTSISPQDLECTEKEDCQNQGKAYDKTTELLQKNLAIVENNKHEEGRDALLEKFNKLETDFYGKTKELRGKLSKDSLKQIAGSSFDFIKNIIPLSKDEQESIAQQIPQLLAGNPLSNGEVPESLPSANNDTNSSILNKFNNKTLVITPFSEDWIKLADIDEVKKERLEKEEMYRLEKEEKQRLEEEEMEKRGEKLRSVVREDFDKMAENSKAKDYNSSDPTLGSLIIAVILIILIFVGLMIYALFFYDGSLNSFTKECLP